MDGAAIEPAEEPLGTADRGIERHVLAGGIAVEGDVQVVDPGARHGDSLMIGWTAEHMELTDGDGQTNRLRYRWNRVRRANLKWAPGQSGAAGTASPRSARSAALCP